MVSKDSNILPEYVYCNQLDEYSFSQGDIIQIDEEFGEIFKKHYPTISNEPYGSRYALILSQSCDIVRRKDRSGNFVLPKTNHIVVCLIRTINDVLHYEMKTIGAKKVSGYYLLQSAHYETLIQKTSRLINNSESKHMFYLPKSSFLKEDMVVLLNISYAFRTEIYDQLLSKRVGGLLPEFRAKIGYIVADYFGRVATVDLTDSGIEESQLLKYAEEKLSDTKIFNGVDSEFISELTTINDPDHLNHLKQEYLQKKNEENLRPLIRGYKKSISNSLFELLNNKLKLEELQGLDEPSLRREITNIIKNWL